MDKAFSIIIPAYNEASSIKRTLDSINGAVEGSPMDLEVVVVDAASTDDTGAVSHALLDGYGLDHQIVRCNETTYPGEARNRGLSAARHDNLIFIDCGVAVSGELLTECERLIDDFDFIWFSPGFDFDKPTQPAYVRPYFMRRDRGRYLRHCAAGKSAVLKAGGFRGDLRAAEDWLFYRELSAAGFRESFSGIKASYYGYPESLAGFYRKWRTYFEHSVYAGLHKNNIRNSLVQLMFVLLLSAALILSGTVWIAAVPIALFAWTMLRSTYSFTRSRIPVSGIRDFLYTFITVPVLEISRITGVLRGLAGK